MASSSGGYKCPLIFNGEPCTGVLPPGNKFCYMCGGKYVAPIMEHLCPACESSVKPKDKFCSECGLTLNIVSDQNPARPSQQLQPAAYVSRGSKCDQLHDDAGATSPAAPQILTAGSPTSPRQLGTSTMEVNLHGVAQVRPQGGRKVFQTLIDDQQNRKSQSRTQEISSQDNVSITFNLMLIGVVPAGTKVKLYYQNEVMKMDVQPIKVEKGQANNFSHYTAKMSFPKDAEIQTYQYAVELPKRWRGTIYCTERTVDVTRSSGNIYQYDCEILGELVLTDSVRDFIKIAIRTWLNQLEFLSSPIRNFDHQLGKLNQCWSSLQLFDEAKQSQCFKEVLQDFHSENVRRLTAGGSEQTRGLHGNAVAIILSLQQYGIQLSPSHTTSLCKALLPHTKGQTCYAGINDTEFGMIAQSLVEFVESSIENTKGDAAVLCCIPLLHFVRRESDPFKSRQLKWGTKKWWGVDGLERAIQLFQQYQKTKDSSAVIQEMKYYFRIDKLLGRTMCLFLGPDDIPLLLPEIDLPLHAVLGTVIYHAEKGYFNTEKFRDILENLVVRVKQTIETTSCAENEVKTSSEVALILIEFLAKSNKNYLDVLSAIELAGIILGSMVVQTSRKLKTKSRMDTYREQVVNWLTEWLRHFPADSDELRVWQTLLKVGFPDDKEAKQWQDTIRQKLRERNNQRCNGKKISIYIESEQCNNLDDFLKTFIRQCAYDATREEMKEGRQDLNFFCYTDCMGYVHMLSSIWIELFPFARTGNITKPEVVLQFLKQPYLTEFLQLHASACTRDHLSKESQTSLILMTDTLKKLKDHLKDNSVDENMLEEVMKMEDSIGKAMRCAGLMKNPSDGETLTQLIKDCQEKMRCFEGHREHVGTLLMFLRMTEHNINRGEIKALEGRLARRYKNIPLSTLSGGKNSFFNIPSNLMKVLPKMQELKNCRVFRRIWKNHLYQKSLCLAGVKEMVWIPSMEEWEVVKQKLKEGSLELTTMKALLSDLSEAGLQSEIKWMLPGDSERLISERLNQISICLQVSKQANVGENIMDLMNTYDLRGTFKVIEENRNAKEQLQKDYDMKVKQEKLQQKEIEQLNKDIINKDQTLENLVKEKSSLEEQYQGLESSLATKAADLKKTLSELNGKERAIKEIVRKFDEEKKELLQTKEQLHSELVAKVEQEKLQREKTEQLNRDITCKNQELENMAKDKSSLEEQKEQLQKDYDMKVKQEKLQQKEIEQLNKDIINKDQTLENLVKEKSSLEEQISSLHYTGICDVKGGPACLNDELVKTLLQSTKIRPELLESIKIDEVMVACLGDFVTINHKDELLNANLYRQTKVETLLTIIENNGRNAFIEFTKALDRCKQKRMRKMLIAGLEKLGLDTSKEEGLPRT